MTTDRDLERVAKAWMASGPAELPNRVLDAVIDEIHLTRQRRPMRAPWRLIPMRTQARVVTAAVIGVLLVGGAFVILGRSGQALVGGPSTRPTTPAAPSTSASASASAPASAPAAVIDLPPLTRTFTSPTYGYSIGMADGWTAKPATKKWVGVDNSPPVVDVVTVTGTDTAVQGVSQAIPKGTTFDRWLVPFHQFTVDSLATNPGCDGGDPSTWPPIQIGNQTGRLQMNCNGAEALAAVGGRAYVFDWSNATFEGTHLALAGWKELLKSVTFEPAAARD